MKRIFELTKPEQRMVILIAVALVAIAFARHWFETKSPPPAATVSSPTASPTARPAEEQIDSDD